MTPAFQFSAPPWRLCLTACVWAAAGAHAIVAYGQGYDTWQKVEQAEETRTYSQQLGEGTFEVPQKRVLETVILSQLEKPANRATIAQVRQRMREIITRGASNPKVFDAANATARDFIMAQLVADDGQDIGVRVNAILLVGELIAADRKAWPGSVEALAKAAGDQELPLAVRIAAVAGLRRQIQDGRGGEPSFAPAVAPVVATIITSPPEGDARAVAWLLGRCLDMVPSVGGTPAVMAAAAKILADDAADLDLRLRATVALGRLVKPEAAIDVTSAVAQVRDIATAALSKDLSEAEARRFAKQLSGGVEKKGAAPHTGVMPHGQPSPPVPPGGGFLGGGIFGGAPAGGVDQPMGMPAVFDPDAVSERACRRNAWRLVTLADAIQPESSKDAGIARVLSGDAATDAIALATVLREQGLAIEATPDEQSVKAAIAAIEATAEAARTEPPVPAPGDPTIPAEPTPPAAETPFGGPGDSSPF